jgi:hypothetical protein
MMPTNVRFKSRRKYQVHPRTVIGAPGSAPGAPLRSREWVAHRASGGRRRSFDRLERGDLPDRAYKNSKLAVLRFTYRCRLVAPGATGSAIMGQPDLPLRQPGSRR